MAVPFTRHYNAEARIGRIRVWGCPVVDKAYQRKDATGSILKDHNMIQRGVRGIYVGFPIDQAGYLIWIPSAQQFAVSADVAFDEDFSSTLAYDDRLTTILFRFVLQSMLPTIPSVLWLGLVLLL